MASNLADDTHFDHRVGTDVVVIGSGASGTGAALRALAHRVRVTVVEKQSMTGGSASLSAGGFWTFKDFRTFRRLAPQGDAALQRKLLDSYSGALGFIRDQGVDV